ncbi:MAG: FmdB family zinc ribbon protein, partial [Acidimicrobiia bacterium]
MPTYVYECNKCGEDIEIFQSFKDDPLKRHPGCGGKLTKVYQPVGIVLKGPGFYKTDSRNGKKSASTSERSESSSDSGSGSGSESKSEKSDKSDAKSDSKKADTKK